VADAGPGKQKNDKENPEKGSRENSVWKKRGSDQQKGPKMMAQECAASSGDQYIEQYHKRYPDWSQLGDP
jgi:hypothetical protein